MLMEQSDNLVEGLPRIHMEDRMIEFDNDVLLDVGWGDPEHFQNVSCVYTTSKDPRTEEKRFNPALFRF